MRLWALFKNGYFSTHLHHPCQSLMHLLFLLLHLLLNLFFHLTCFTGTVTTDMMEAEIRANVPVVKRLHKLQDSFSGMMVTIRKHLANCNLSDITFYLDDIIGTRDFSSCDNIYDLLQQLRERYIDTFNIYTLHRLLSFIKNRELDELVEAYENKKEEFLKHTTVLDFQQAVANKVKPVILKGSAKVTIKVSEELATNRTLKDVENLVKEVFEPNQRSLVQLHAEPGSVVMMWLFPDVLIATLTNLSHKNAAVFKAAGVEEVTVDGRSVFHKVMPQTCFIIPSYDALCNTEIFCCCCCRMISQPHKVLLICHTLSLSVV